MEKKSDFIFAVKVHCESERKPEIRKSGQGNYECTFSSKDARNP